MASDDDRWYFTKEQLYNTPSRKCGVDHEKEMSYRQQASKLIQDMGQRLQVTQLAISTGIVYMQRFYMYHSFTRFHRQLLSPAALFLAAKVEEQPRKLEHVIKVAHHFWNSHEHIILEVNSEAYQEKCSDLVAHENILLQTLGFDVAIDHPHTYVVKCFHMVRATTDLAHSSYFMATNSLHMTTMCLQYKPSVVACVCIFIVCKWSNYEIQRFTEGKNWWENVDPTVTRPLLEQLTAEFLQVLEKYPKSLKKIMTGSANSAMIDDRLRPYGSGLSSSSRALMPNTSAFRNSDLSKQIASTSRSSSSSSGSASSKTVLSHKEYAEKREKERRERDKINAAAQHSSGHSSTLNTAIASSSGAQQQQGSMPPPSRAHSSENSMRKTHGDLSRSLPSQNANVRGHGNAIKQEAAVRRDAVASSTRPADERITERLHSDKLKHTVDNRQFHSGDWPQSRHSLDNLNNKDSKLLDIKKENSSSLLDVKSEIKKETSSNLVDTNPDVKDLLPKYTSPSLPPVKLEPKKEVKEPLLLKEPEIKSNSFFSFKDLAHPPDMPPDDIFDNEGDTGKPTPDSPISHRKTKSPTIKVIPTLQSVHIPVSIPTNNVVVPPTRIETPPVVQESPLDIKSSSSTVNHNLQSLEKNVGNGYAKTTVPSSSSISQVPIIQQSSSSSKSKKKDKNRSPHSSSKSRHHTATIVGPPQNLPRQPQHSTTHSSESLKQKDTTFMPPPKTTTTIASLNLPLSSQAAVEQQQVRSVVPTTKTSLAESVKLDQTLKVRMPILDNCDIGALVAPSVVLPSAATAAPTVLDPLRRHKHEHSHKHKEKKKNKKHREKDKHKDKEHKKNKKHKKNKDKDKEKSEKLPKDDAPPLKIKLTLGEKGVYSTPDPTPAVSHLRESSTTGGSIISKTTGSFESPVAISYDGTPGRIKLTIPKSRLQTPGSDIPEKESRKSKSHKESRKRDRDHMSPPGTMQPTKLARSSTSVPQVLDSSRWSSQRH